MDRCRDAPKLALKLKTSHELNEAGIERCVDVSEVRGVDVETRSGRRERDDADEEVRPVEHIKRFGS